VTVVVVVAGLVALASVRRMSDVTVLRREAFTIFLLFNH